MAQRATRTWIGVLREYGIKISATYREIDSQARDIEEISDQPMPDDVGRNALQGQDPEEEDDSGMRPR